MATTSSPAALMPVIPVFTGAERLALAGYLAGYTGLTRQAYELDLRQYVTWCHQHQCAVRRCCSPDGGERPPSPGRRSGGVKLGAA